MKYDGLNRRSVKAVQNTGHLDCTYHYYYDKQWRILEERNGSDGVLKQQVWAPLPTSGGAPGSAPGSGPGSGGSGYVDELVQVAVNIDPINNPTMNWTPPLPGVPPRAYWVMQDANYNVLGLVDATGALKERYEYTPYGQRQVFISAGANDPDCYVGQYISARAPTSTAGVVQPYGLCEFGHQGLLHEEELGNGAYQQNRGRERSLVLGWMQPDRYRYIDGANYYQYVRSDPINAVDPSGFEYRISNGPYGPRWNAKSQVCEIYFTIDYAPSWYDYLLPWYTQTPSTERAYPLNGLQECECTKQKIADMAKAGDSTIAVQITHAMALQTALNVGYNSAGVTADGFALSAAGMVVGGVVQLHNVAGEVNGTQYSGHAFDQMKNRGIMPSVVDNTIQNGTTFPTRAGTTGYYDAVNNVRVIVNSTTGQVVTVIRGAP